MLLRFLTLPKNHHNLLCWPYRYKSKTGVLPTTTTNNFPSCITRNVMTSTNERYWNEIRWCHSNSNFLAAVIIKHKRRSATSDGCPLRASCRCRLHSQPLARWWFSALSVGFDQRNRKINMRFFLSMWSTAIFQIMYLQVIEWMARNRRRCDCNM